MIRNLHITAQTSNMFPCPTSAFILKRKKNNDISISKVLLAGRGMGKCPSVSLWRGKVVMGEKAGGNEVMTVVMEAEAVSGRERIRSSTGECEPADRADR